jgi:hypothetical protein
MGFPVISLECSGARSKPRAGRANSTVCTSPGGYLLLADTASWWIRALLTIQASKPPMSSTTTIIPRTLNRK